MNKLYQIALTGLLLTSAIFGETTNQCGDQIETVKKITIDMIEKRNDNNLSTLQQQVSEHIAVDMMAPRIVGRQAWLASTQHTRDEFTELFRTLITKEYMKVLDRIPSTEQFTILPDRGKESNGKTGRVNALLNQDGDSLKITFMLQCQNDHWQLTDILVNHLSYIEIIRQQYAAFIRHHSLAELNTKIKKKAGTN